MSEKLTQKELKELDAINERQRARADEIVRELQAAEYEAVREWGEGRGEGAGVTPGTSVRWVSPDAFLEANKSRWVEPPLGIEDADVLADETVNPKQQAATRDQKPPLHLLEYAADIEIAKALAYGAHKYGRKNFHETPILANVYGGAIRRHIGAWLDGEDYDTGPNGSGLSHLAHIGANIHVLFAAMAHGTFEDDRGPEPRSAVQQRMSDASNARRP